MQYEHVPFVGMSIMDIIYMAHKRSVDMENIELSKISIKRYVSLEAATSGSHCTSTDFRCNPIHTPAHVRDLH